MSEAVEVLVLSRGECEELGEEIACFATRANVALHAMLSRLRRFDAAQGWGHQGFLSCAHWLAWRVHIGAKTAREHVRVARVLGELPLVDAAFGRGELSYSKVRAITRVGNAVNEQELINLAMVSTAGQLEKLLRCVQLCQEQASAEAQALRAARRRVWVSDVGDGMVKIEAVLPAEEAAVVTSALEGAMDSEASAGASEVGARRADALVDMARGYLQHKPRTLGSGYELVVVTTPEQLEGGRDGVGGFLRDGTPVSVAVARALAADGARVDVSVGAEGELLSVGRRTRSIPAAVSRALWLRDGGCRVPGCGRKRHLHAHHVKEWADGGETRLSNLLLVCSTHHRLVHEGRLRISAGEASAEAHRFEVLDELGRAMPWVPAMKTEASDLDALEEWLENEGVSVAAAVSEPKWDGSGLRLGEAVSVMLASPGFG